MASNDFNTSLPSIRQIQKCQREKLAVELKLLTGDVIIGNIFWQDHNCISIVDDVGGQTTIWKQAIAYMKPLGDMVQERQLVPQNASVEIMSA
jgi:host factor-I protein